MKTGVWCSGIVVGAGVTNSSASSVMANFFLNLGNSFGCSHLGSKLLYSADIGCVYQWSKTETEIVIIEFDHTLGALNVCFNTVLKSENNHHFFTYKNVLLTSTQYPYSPYCTAAQLNPTMLVRLDWTVLLCKSILGFLKVHLSMPCIHCDSKHAFYTPRLSL